MLLNRKCLALALVLGTGALGSGVVTGTAPAAVQSSPLGDPPQWWSPAPPISPPVTPGTAPCRGVGTRLAVFCRIIQRVARQCAGLRGRWRSACVRRVLRSMTGPSPLGAARTDLA